MNIKKTKALLEKYFEGKTTLQEEYELSEMLSDSSLPKELQQYNILFDFFKVEKNNTVSDNFEQELDTAIQNDIKNKKKLYSIFSIAASVIIIIGISFSSFFNTKHYNQEKVIAYHQTNEALIYMSHYLNVGIQPLNNMARNVTESEVAFERSIKYLNNLNKVSCGYDNMKVFSKYFNYQPIQIN